MWTLRQTDGVFLSNVSGMSVSQNNHIPYKNDINDTVAKGFFIPLQAQKKTIIIERTDNGRLSRGEHD
ncbi:MAG: hypothetical protein MSA10_00550 [Paraprevotella sp.]|nr:hypothetical protein [Paraprevotella sp.]MCI7141487.1 hypothetical protein [Paraprevotella sp.]MDY5963121.1 hypothetical protein [Bacteroidaceae bacterium]